MKKFIYFLLIFIVIIACIGFSSFNSGQEVTMKFLGFRLEAEYSYFVIISLLVGLLLGYIFSSLKGVKHRVKARKLNRKLTKSEAEVTTLKDKVGTSLQ